MNLKKKIKDKIVAKLANPIYNELKRLEREDLKKSILFKRFGPNSFLNGDNHKIISPENLEIGENVHLDENSFINAGGNAFIGDNTHIGRNLILNTIEHNYTGTHLPINDQVIKKKVIIGKNVWIGMNVCILPGTVIGDGCIIAMGTTVSGDIPPLSIVRPGNCSVVGKRDADHYYDLDEKKLYRGVNGNPYNLGGRKTLDELGDIYNSRRSRSELILHNGTKAVKKTYFDSDDGEIAYKAEIVAYQKFKTYSWCPQLLDKGQNSIIIEYFPSETRLDKIINPSRELLEEILWCLLDIFTEGYAHRDFHSKNIFITEDGVKIIDFETIAAVACKDFFKSYDVIGQGLVSPFLTGNMCIMNSSEISMSSIFKINSIGELKQNLDVRFKKQMLNSSITFKSLRAGISRHQLQTQNIYASFNLLNTKISPSISQRNTSNRIKKFGIEKEIVRDKKVLDIGSNIGATLLGLAVYEPQFMLGIEYDADKVLLSNKLAKYNQIENILFRQGDIENINEFSEKFDIVFCLAVIEHLKEKDKLFEFLGKVCSDKLYFEGNGNSDTEYILQNLRKVGFTNIEYLGFSDDEKNQSNNNRPLFIVSK